MTDDKQNTKSKDTDKRPGWLIVIRTIISVIMIIFNIIAAVCMLCSGYAHLINPESVPVITVTAMTFPICFAAVVFLFVLDLIWWRRTAWIAGLAMLCCLGPIKDFSPLNIPRFRMSAAEKEKSFTLMTYNVFAWKDYRKEDVKSNRQLAYILEKQPDVVCIQEAEYLAPIAGTHITQEQLEQLHSIYPYVLTQGENFAIFSKYPAKPINLDFPTNKFKSGDMAAWRLNIDGHVVNVFSVHLRSFSLTKNDKDTYQEIVKLDKENKSELAEARRSILPKLKSAAIDRAEQIKYLEKYLAKYGGHDAIVVGDFNDAVLCYGLSQLEKNSHMHQAYTDVGFGPAITYNASKLYFRIDHVLYRGNIYPYSIKRCGINASDHYPLFTTFVLNY